MSRLPSRSTSPVPRFPYTSVFRSTVGADLGAKRCRLERTGARPCFIGKASRPSALLQTTSLEPAFLEIDEGLHQLLAGVHHERPVAGDRLAQRTTGNEDQARAVLAGLQPQDRKSTRLNSSH